MARVALYQAQTGIDPAANRADLAAAARDAAAGGAAMLFTPEMSGLLDANRERARDHVVAEDDDPTLAAVREAAARDGLWIHLGSLALQAGDGRFANRGFVIDPAGEIRGRYDKIHLFARLAEAGADTIAVPAAFTVPTGKAHWHILLRARAIEAGLFVIAAAQGGRHQDDRATYGHSLVIDPWGEPLLDMGPGDTPRLAFAEVDLARITEVRARVPALEHRRPIPAI